MSAPRLRIHLLPVPQARPTESDVYALGSLHEAGSAADDLPRIVPSAIIE
jgi:hypothetical protein